MGSTESASASASFSRARVRIERLHNFAPRGPSLSIFFLFFAALLVTRRPDCILLPQFWAEEGKQFFVDAWHRSAWINLTSYSLGYFYLSIRLVSQIAVLVPLQYGPLVFVLSALVIQASVPTFAVSSRCAVWLGPFPIRLAAALLYCGMPDSFEEHCIALTSRIHLIILAALIIVSAPPRAFPGKLFDISTLILAGLSGPFVLLLAPVAIWWHWRVRSSATRRNCLILAATLCCAIFALLASVGSRVGPPLGAGLFEFIRIVGGQLAMGFFLGEKTYATIVQRPYFTTAAVVSLLILSILLVLIVLRERWEVRTLLIIGFGLFALGLASPIGATSGMTQWHVLWSIPGCGQRYFFVPMAMTLFALAAVAGRGQGRVWRGAAIVLLVLVAIMGARVDWRLPAFTDFQFRHYANLYRSIPPGASLTVPINPPGWEMKLKKLERGRR
jgi:hypothetical protein